MFSDFLNIIFSTEFGYSVLRVSTPILLAALGVLISYRAGVINIAIEGMMLIAALTGVIFSALTQNAFVGLLMALVLSSLTGMLLAYCALSLKTDVILSAIAINLIAAGGTVFVLFLVAGDKGISLSLASVNLPKIDIPIIKNIPVVGPIFSGHNIITYIAIICVGLMHYFLYWTPLGLQIRAVGESPDAADSVGISVKKTQFIALTISGFMAGLGGAYMSMGYVSWFSANMTAGRGFIGLAAEAMGATPIGCLFTSLLFGFFDALSNSLQLLHVPAEFVQMVPYLATVVGLVIYTASKKKQAQKMMKKIGQESVNE